MLYIQNENIKILQGKKVFSSNLKNIYCSLYLSLAETFIIMFE